MREVAEWIRGTLASRREVNRQRPGDVALGTVLDHVIADRATHGLPGTERLIDDEGAASHVLEDEWAAAILFVGSTTEPSPGAELLASERGFPRLPFAEDGIFTVDTQRGTVLETLPLPGQKTGPRINGDAVHKTDRPGRARILDRVVRGIKPRTRPRRRARLRVEELGTANPRQEEFLAMLSLEFRSPLAAIQNAVRLLSSQTGETPARQKAPALIERQVRRMTQLVDDLLEVSRISHGRLHLQRERTEAPKTTSRSAGR